MDFPCVQCGACCRRLHLANPETLKANGLEHVDGVCTNLADDGVTCTIFEDRPIVCRAEDTAKLWGVDKMLFYRETAKLCNQFMEEDGIDDFIPLEQFDD